MKEGWEYKKLGEITIKITDGSHNPPAGIDFSEYPMLSSKNIFFDHYDYIQPRYLTKEQFEIEDKRTNIEHGDVLLTIVGTVGRACCIDTPFQKFTLQRSVAVLKPNKEKILSRFLMYGMISMQNLFNEEARGAAQKGIYLKQLSNIPIPVPPLAEQERIVSILDKAYEKIDAIKANAEENLANAKALFHAALKKELTPKEGWEEIKISQICDIFGRIGFRGYTKADMVTSPKDGAISLSPGNIIDGEMDYSKCTYISWEKYEESPEIKIFNDDILVVKTGSSYGKSALVRNLPHEATINPQSVVLKNIKINRQFLALVLQSSSIRKKFDDFVIGTAIPTFSQKKLGDITLSIPKEIKQQEISSKLEGLRSRCKEMDTNLLKVSCECDALKQAILRKAFNGEL